MTSNWRSSRSRATTNSSAACSSVISGTASRPTVIWNGTLGFTESAPFSTASGALAKVLADDSSQIDSIIGGGDTADFVIHWDARHGDSFGHVSTGGGASLELMSGEKLPGIEALLDAR